MGCSDLSGMGWDDSDTRLLAEPTNQLKKGDVRLTCDVALLNNKETDST